MYVNHNRTYIFLKLTIVNHYICIYRVDNKYGIFAGNALTCTHRSSTYTIKNGYIVEHTKGV